MLLLLSPLLKLYDGNGGQSDHDYFSAACNLSHGIDCFGTSPFFIWIGYPIPKYLCIQCFAARPYNEQNTIDEERGGGREK